MSQFTNVLTGESLTVDNSGKVVIIPQEDGSLTVIQTGLSVAGDQGKVTGDPYLVHVTDLCAALASGDRLVDPSVRSRKRQHDIVGLARLHNGYDQR